jgi:hypothetical protein
LTNFLSSGILNKQEEMSKGIENSLVIKSSDEASFVYVPLNISLPLLVLPYIFSENSTKDMSNMIKGIDLPLLLINSLRFIHDNMNNSLSDLNIHSESSKIDGFSIGICLYEHIYKRIHNLLIKCLEIDSLFLFPHFNTPPLNEPSTKDREIKFTNFLNKPLPQNSLLISSSLSFSSFISELYVKSITEKEKYFALILIICILTHNCNKLNFVEEIESIFNRYFIIPSQRRNNYDFPYSTQLFDSSDTFVSPFSFPPTPFDFLLFYTVFCIINKYKQSIVFSFKYTDNKSSKLEDDKNCSYNTDKEIKKEGFVISGKLIMNNIGDILYSNSDESFFLFA